MGWIERDRGLQVDVNFHSLDAHHLHPRLSTLALYANSSPPPPESTMVVDNDTPTPPW